MTTKKPAIDHPGAFIAAEPRRREWVPADLAYILNIDGSRLNKVLAGKAHITAQLAVALGAALDMPAEIFLDLQNAHSLAKAAPAKPGVRTRAYWQSHFPIQEMTKRGWIEDSEPEALGLQMMRFFGVSRIEDVPFVSGSGGQ